jgi:mono/diheme cytochrome c family protein
MKRQLILLLAMAAAVWACGGADSTSATAVSTGSSNQPDGAKIYKTYCVACHGLYGNMGASGAHNLQESELSLEERIEVITNGRNTMTPYKSLLSEDKIKAVAEYTLTLKSED